MVIGCSRYPHKCPDCKCYSDNPHRVLVCPYIYRFEKRLALLLWTEAPLSHTSQLGVRAFQQAYLMSVGGVGVTEPLGGWPFLRRSGLACELSTQAGRQIWQPLAT